MPYISDETLDQVQIAVEQAFESGRITITLDHIEACLSVELGISTEDLVASLLVLSRGERAPLEARYEMLCPNGHGDPGIANDDITEVVGRPRECANCGLHFTPRKSSIVVYFLASERTRRLMSMRREEKKRSGCQS